MNKAIIVERLKRIVPLLFMNFICTAIVAAIISGVAITFWGQNQELSVEYLSRFLRRGMDVREVLTALETSRIAKQPAVDGDSIRIGHIGIGSFFVPQKSYIIELRDGRATGAVTVEVVFQASDVEYRREFAEPADINL